MAKRKIKNKRYNKSRVIIIGSLFIALGIFIIGSKYLYNYFEIKNEEQLIDTFFEEQQEIIETTISEKKEILENNKLQKTNSKKENYIAVIEIPKINLKKGLFDKNSQLNKVDKNIQILNESKMPDVPNSILALAGHSGSSNKSFFKKLYQLSYDDEVIVYYNQTKYIYKVVDIYFEKRNGNINISYRKDTNIIVLTTCAKEQDRQLIVVGELVNKDNLY